VSSLEGGREEASLWDLNVSVDSVSMQYTRHPMVMPSLCLARGEVPKGAVVSDRREGGYLVGSNGQRRGGGGVGDAGAARAAGAGNRGYRTRHMRAEEVESAEGVAALHLGFELGRHCQYGSWRQRPSEAGGGMAVFLQGGATDVGVEGTNLIQALGSVTLTKRKSRRVAAKRWCSISSVGAGRNPFGDVDGDGSSWCDVGARGAGGRASQRARKAAGWQRRVECALEATQLAE
jgi:hypothetical protein